MRFFLNATDYKDYYVKPVKPAVKKEPALVMP